LTIDEVSSPEIIALSEMFPGFVQTQIFNSILGELDLQTAVGIVVKVSRGPFPKDECHVLLQFDWELAALTETILLLG
jgi:hypothetical protein